MRTDDLIARLALSPAAAPFRPLPIAGATVAVIALCSAGFLAVTGLRADLAVALASPWVVAKTLVPAMVFVLSLAAVMVMARPGRAARGLVRALALPVAVAAGLWVLAYADLPADRRFADVGAFSLSECVGLISLLSALPAAVLVGLLRHGATTRPRLVAFLAGLAAASGATTGYSLFCVQDNPLFFVTWYGVAILLVACITAVFGTRLLRW